ncbi:MAG: type IX secretion system membrane protein PorP/SprF [Bacteroidota bacterium]|nr:type IX secretion system membrane protein PorP/SprF [Bacteroidota bacterium]
MIRLFLIVPFAMLFGSVLAQQDPICSQYMFNNMAINPGYAGSKDQIAISAIHRLQWVGQAGAPTTSTFSIHTPFKIGKVNNGIGLTFVNDKYAFDNNIGISLAYAYRMDVNDGAGKLGIGVSGGFINNSLNATWITTGNATPAANDPTIPNQTESTTTLNFDLGLYYQTDKLYFGISSTNLTQPKKNYSKGSPLINRHYYLTSGYNLPLANPAFEIQPSVFLATDGASSSLDLNTVVTYNKRVWGGFSYRLSAAVVGMVGLELINGLRIGYAYDFSTTNLNKYNNGTHEIMMGYNFSIVKPKVPHRYKSVRFL